MGADDYIMFVLGVDTSKISKIIREKLNETSDLWEMYNTCSQIAYQFEIYDKQYYNIYSRIDSFYKFLEEYEKEIIDYINGDAEIFEIKKEH
jgi:hypothetical protein